MKESPCKYTLDNLRHFNRARGRGLYRLGEAAMKIKGAMAEIIDPKNNFHNTIGHKYVTEVVLQYLNKTTMKNNRSSDIGLLRSLVSEYIQLNNCSLPKDDELVIHLRMGDSNRVNDSHHFISVITPIIDKVRPRHITIVTAVHNCFEEALLKDNSIILSDITEFLSSTHIPFKIKSSDVDADFCYLVTAKHLAISNGNFSLIAGLCNENCLYPDMIENPNDLFNLIFPY